MALTQWQLKPVATENTIASGDFLAFTDESETGDPINKITVDNLASFFAGTGISAASGVLNVDAAQTGITSVGALDVGSITSGFTSIDVGSGAISTTGAVATGALTATGNIIIPNAGTIGSASDTDALAISSGGVVNFTQAPTVASAAIKTVAAGTNGRPDFRVLDFSHSSDEHAQFTIAMPKSWDGGNIYFYAYWIGIAATTGVAWGLEVLSLNDNEDFDQAYINPIIVQDDAQGDATELLVSAKSAAIACSGADNDLLCFQVYRDVSDGNDDMAGDARLWGLLLEYTPNAATDA